MKILLSPAKSIDFDKVIANHQPTKPVFLDEAAYLINKLRKLSAKKIGSLMHVSSQIATLNYNRFQNWKLPFTSENSKPAADIFTGAAYQGLDYSSLNEQSRLDGQSYLRILSGLYGLLKPLDLIQPYRLEMGTRFNVTPKTTNLYKYWGHKICDQLNDELKQDEFPVLVNLASSEYFKAAKLELINFPVITPIFKDRSKLGDYKVIMTFAKKARGLMCRYIIKNEINEVELLKGFNYEGYAFSATESTEKELDFLSG